MAARALLVAVALAALIAGIALAWWATTPSPPARSADALFEQRLVDADGVEQALSQWRGQLLVVNFWATWCAPCVEEMPELERVHRDYRARGVSLIGVGIDSPQAIRAFRDQLKLTLPLLVAGAEGSNLARELGNPSAALPYTVLIDREGRIAQARLGRIHETELRRWLESRVAR